MTLNLPSAPQEQEYSENYLMDLGDMSLDEIVGQEQAVKELKTLVESIKYKDLYAAWGIASPRGVLLVGPPGTGKTQSVKALAREIQDIVTLMELRYLDIASKWIDAPIEHLNAFFKRAEQESRNRHVLIFIDELEGMIPSRQGQLHETSSKRVNAFLEWMDGGFKKLQNITVLGATNFLEGVDEAARRPGRFDKIVNYHNLKSKDIALGLKIHLSKRDLIEEVQITDIDWKAVEEEVDRFTMSGADLPEIINTMLNEKVKKHIKNIENNGDCCALDSNLQKIYINDIQFYPSPVTTESVIHAIREYPRGNNGANRIGFGFQPVKDSAKHFAKQKG